MKSRIKVSELYPDYKCPAWTFKERAFPAPSLHEKNTITRRKENEIE
jgi:hypothetical protein